MDAPWKLCMFFFFLNSTENTFCSGDHVSWHSPLDNSESRIQHMLLTEDPQMQPIQTPFGTVSFLQVTVKNKHPTDCLLFRFHGRVWLQATRFLIHFSDLLYNSR